MPALLFCIGLGLLLGFEEAGAFFLPGDISLLAAGVRARGEEGPILFLALWGTSTLSMVAGASSLYHTLRISNRFDRIMPRQAREMIQRHGVWGVAVARILPGLRNATVFAAASSNLSYRRFLMGLVPAAMVWSGVVLLTGWFGGAAILTTFGKLHQSHALRFVSLALLALAALFLAWRMLSTHGSGRGMPTRREGSGTAIQDRSA